jgi:hypothetical protein
MVFRVSRSADHKWDVCEDGFEKPLASFDSRELAAKYANDIARTKGESSVIFEASAGG